MAVTQDEFNDFTAYVNERLANGGADSMADLVADWESRRSVAAIGESHADAEAGRTSPAEDVFAETRKNLGIE